MLAIYAPYVRETAITFETEVPSVEEFEGRIATIQATYPYLVAEVDGEPVGCAYAHAYYGRAAYAWTVEVSIYVDQKAGGKVLGMLFMIPLKKNFARRGFVKH